MLVEERLDSKSLKDSKINLSFLSNSININRKSSSKVPSIKAKRVGDVGVKRADNETGVEAKKQGNKIVWTNFEEYSNAISYFDSFVNNIEKQSKNAGRLIDETKNIHYTYHPNYLNRRGKLLELSKTIKSYYKK